MTFKNILITGGCGFIGSNFINYMTTKYKDLNFINIDALYYSGSKDNINDIFNYEFIYGNINDYNLIISILKNKNIDTIIHFAAQSHVDNSFLEPLKYTEDNIKGTHTLLEAVKNTNKNIKFIHISTDEVYGESKLNEESKKETDILSPTNPYAASKAAAEMIINSYIYSFNLNIIIIRSNNVYGKNQYPEKLIPKFINLLENNKKCTIHGNGSALRSFIHVNDVCSAIECILFKGTIHEIYNIGSNNEISVLDVTKLLINIIKKDNNYDNYIAYIDDRPFNDKRYFINNDKLIKLGWIQKIYFNSESLQELL